MNLDTIQDFINEEINPMLNIHKGYCEALGLSEGVLTVKLLGGCAGCPSARMTLFNGVEPRVLEKFPGLEAVELG